MAKWDSASDTDWPFSSNIYLTIIVPNSKPATRKTFIDKIVNAETKNPPFSEYSLKTVLNINLNLSPWVYLTFS